MTRRQLWLRVGFVLAILGLATVLWLGRSDALWGVAPAPGRVLLPIRVDGKSGVVDTQGQVLVEPVYDQVMLMPATVFARLPDMDLWIESDAPCLLGDIAGGSTADIAPFTHQAGYASTWILTGREETRWQAVRHWPFLVKTSGLVITLLDSSGRVFARGQTTHREMFSRRWQYDLQALEKRPGTISTMPSPFGSGFPVLSVDGTVLAVCPEGLRRIAHPPPGWDYLLCYLETGETVTLLRDSDDSVHVQSWDDQARPLQTVTSVGDSWRSLVTQGSPTSPEDAWEFEVPDLDLPPAERGPRYIVSRRSGKRLELRKDPPPGFRHETRPSGFDLMVRADSRTATVWAIDGSYIAAHIDYLAVRRDHQITIYDHDLRVIVQAPTTPKAVPTWHRDSGPRPSLHLVEQPSPSIDASIRLIWDIDQPEPQIGLYHTTVGTAIEHPGLLLLGPESHRSLDFHQWFRGIFHPETGRWIVPVDEGATLTQRRIHRGWILTNRDGHYLLPDADLTMRPMPQLARAYRLQSAALSRDGQAVAISCTYEDPETLIYEERSALLLPGHSEPIHLRHTPRFVPDFDMPAAPDGGYWLAISEAFQPSPDEQTPPPDAWAISRFSRSSATRQRLYDPNLGDFRPEVYATVSVRHFPTGDSLIVVKTLDGRIGYLRADGTWLWEPTR